MIDMTKRVKVAMMDYIADLTGAGASQAELKIAIEMSKTVMDAMRSEQSECCTAYCSPYFSIRRQADEVLEKMCDMIDHCGYATIEYLMYLSGSKTSPYTTPLYAFYGWDNLRSAYIKSDVNNKNYYIVLPGVKKVI